MPFGDGLVFDLEEGVRTDGEVFEVAFADQEEEFPREGGETVHGEVEFLEESEAADGRGDGGEFVVAETEDAEGVEVEDLTGDLGEGVAGEEEAEERLQGGVDVFADGRLFDGGELGEVLEGVKEVRGDDAEGEATMGIG